MKKETEKVSAGEVFDKTVTGIFSVVGKIFHAIVFTIFINGILNMISHNHD